MARVEYITTVNTVKIKPAAGFGPAPVRAGASGRPLSGERAAVLERLQHQGAPGTVSTLAEQFGLHRNTVREHLDALVEGGAVVHARAPSAGRGRPAWHYAASVDYVEQDVRLRDYAGLTRGLATHLERTSADAGADARGIGRTWGGELAANAPATADDPRHRTLALLTELGFAPQSDGTVTTAALRRCPLLDVARAHPDVVCNVHLGIVQGALAAFGGDPAPAALLPFAEPDACRLHLAEAVR